MKLYRIRGLISALLSFLWRRSNEVVLPALVLTTAISCFAQDQKLTPERIRQAFELSAEAIAADPFRPAFHLTPPAGCMGDPNGGIVHDGWYHIFYGQQPFGPHPGGWYWGHARSRDLLNWERLPPNLTPAFDHGLRAVGSGSTITLASGKALAFYSSGRGKGMEFWRAEMSDDLNAWEHTSPEPILSLQHPGLPPFDSFWRDPFVFQSEGRTFLIACADLFDEDHVPVPIFEAEDDELRQWAYRGILFTYPKHKLRNLEVPELRKLGDRWIFLASSDAPIDRCYYFVGDFNHESLTFEAEQEGIVDYSGHYYAQETIQNEDGELYLMAWMPGWDRDWLPKYRNAPLKNDHPLWNGVFALPRKLSLSADNKLIQQPMPALERLRGKHTQIAGRELRVTSSIVEYDVLEEIRGDQLELQAVFALDAASFCGINLLANEEGHAGFDIQWSGNLLEVDGIQVPMEGWKTGGALTLQIFVDKRWVEVFVDSGRYCVSRQLPIKDVKGDRIALTSLGGTGRLVSLEAWDLSPIQQSDVLE